MPATPLHCGLEFFTWQWTANAGNHQNCAFENIFCIPPGHRCYAMCHAKTEHCYDDTSACFVRAPPCPQRIPARGGRAFAAPAGVWYMDGMQAAGCCPKGHFLLKPCGKGFAIYEIRFFMQKLLSIARCTLPYAAKGVSPVRHALGIVHGNSHPRWAGRLRLFFAGLQ